MYNKIIQHKNKQPANIYPTKFQYLHCGVLYVKYLSNHLHTYICIRASRQSRLHFLYIRF